MMPSRIITPPLSELTSFEAFSAAMLSAPLDEIHKIYDDGGEHDLEAGYDGDESEEDMATHVDVAHPINLMTDPFSDSEEDVDGETDEDLPSYEFIDPRFDIDRTNLTPEHAKSRHINPELQSTIDQTETFLEQLRLKFQPMIEEQPMSTTIVLANQAVEQVLMPYRVHGSQARLSESAMKFLSSGTRVRRPGRDGLDGSKDGILRFVEHSPDEKQDRLRVERLKRKADEGSANNDMRKSKGLKITIRKRSDGTSVFVRTAPKKSISPDVLQPATPKSGAKTKKKHSDSNISSKRVGYGYQSGGILQLDEPKAQVDELSNRKTSGPLDINELQATGSQESIGNDSKEMEICAQGTTSTSSSSSLRRRQPTLTIDPVKATKARTIFTPLANSFSNIAIQTPVSTPFCLSQATTACDRTDTYSCTIDPAANSALALEAFNPLSMKLMWPASVSVRGESKPCMPTPGILDAFNNIIHLVNAEGRNMLSYYVRKYDTSTGIGGSPLSYNTNFSSTTGKAESNEPPHALFRLGISQYLHSRVGNIVDTKESNELGLNTEARQILGEVWERFPSVNARFDDDFLDSNVTVNDHNGVTFGRFHSASPSLTEALPDSESDMDVDSNEQTTNHDDGPEFAKKHNLNKFHMGLNPIERALLARACNVSVETVEAYWDNMKEKTKAWGAMKLWCEAQSRKKIEKAKREGRW